MLVRPLLALPVLGLLPVEAEGLVVVFSEVQFGSTTVRRTLVPPGLFGGATVLPLTRGSTERFLRLWSSLGFLRRCLLSRPRADGLVR